MVIKLYKSIIKINKIDDVNLNNDHIKNLLFCEVNFFTKVNSEIFFNNTIVDNYYIIGENSNFMEDYIDDAILQINPNTESTTMSFGNDLEEGMSLFLNDIKNQETETINYIVYDEKNIKFQKILNIIIIISNNYNFDTVYLN